MGSSGSVWPLEASVMGWFAISGSQACTVWKMLWMRPGLRWGAPERRLQFPRRRSMKTLNWQRQWNGKKGIGKYNKSGWPFTQSQNLNPVLNHWLSKSLAPWATYTEPEPLAIQMLIFSLVPERAAKRGLEPTSTYAQRRIMSWLTFLISRPRWIFRSKSFLHIYRTFLPEQPVFLWVLHWEGGRSCTKLQPVILTLGVNKTATSLSSVLCSQPVLNLSRFVCLRIFMRVFMIIIQMWQNSLKLGENVL